MREQICGDENDQSKNKEVFEVMLLETKKRLRDGQHVIYDATNLNYKRRMDLIRQVERIDPEIEKVCCFMATPFSVCCERNRSRERVVPDDVMDRMYKSITIPDYYEGWDIIDTVYHDMGSGYRKPITQVIYELVDYDQKNPYHAKTLGDHLTSAFYEALNYIIPGRDEEIEKDVEILFLAAALHDCGKPYCQSFDESGIAHYIGHERVSAYDSLFYSLGDVDVNMRKVAVLIQWHMVPMKWSAKTEEKYRKLWGETLYKMVMLLHRADLEAK
jgi:hypothetical protein